MHFIKHFATLLLITLIVANCSSQQEPKGVYDEKNYVEERRERNDRHTIIYFKNKDNADYTIRKIYSDSIAIWKDSISFTYKFFYYKNLLNGPSEQYTNGKITKKEFYQKGKKHGEFIFYDPDGNISEKRFYKEGERAGTWEFYNSNLILHKKVYYDDKGEFVKKELFNQKTGKYERTEYKEDPLFDH